ncbi:hypothetical protein AURDEDRAFT_117087, partial [Auricularia subglabra TFB-10046 SS5]
MLQLDVNRYAGHAEAALLREQLEHDAKDAVELEARLLKASTAQHTAEVALLAAQEAADSARAYTSRIRTQKELVDQRMLRARGLLHPVRRVPEELLSQIFLHLLAPYHWFNFVFQHYKDMRVVPFACAAVCRSWRVTALSTPKLWSLIAFDNSDVTEASVGAWEAYLDAFESHSKSAALSLGLILNHPVDTAICSALEGLVYALVSRCKRVHIKMLSAPSEGTIHVFPEFLWNAFQTVRELNLAAQGVAASSCTIDGLPALLCLQSLTLDSFWLPWDQLPALPTVKYAALRPGLEFGVTADQLASAVSSMSALE